MSIKLMTKVWERTDVSSTQKLVLLALADWANDDGLCWPSIARLATKSSLGTRAIQNAIRSMEEMRLIEREEVAGKGNRYWIRMDTPARDAPLHEMHPTPALNAPNTSYTHHTIDKAQPDWLPLEAWNGWLEMRRKQGKPASERAMKIALGKLDAMRQSGMNIEEVLDRSTTNCWTDIYPLKENGNGSTPGRNYTNNRTADGVSAALNRRLGLG